MRDNAVVSAIFQHNNTKARLLPRAYAHKIYANAFFNQRLPQLPGKSVVAGFTYESGVTAKQCAGHGLVTALAPGAKLIFFRKHTFARVGHTGG